MEELVSKIGVGEEDNIVIPDNFDTPLPLSTIRDQIKVILSQRKKKTPRQEPTDNSTSIFIQINIHFI